MFTTAEKVLNELSLTVPEKSIYGFLGPNGAGKTTALKLILGLLKKQLGEIRIFGKPFLKNRLEILRNIGSLIESPSFYGQLTAFENLQILQKIYQCPPKRIDQVLEIVGLEHTKRKKVGQFSLGMKQRLGIAQALLHQPRLLILDEPTNGLDPNGILEMRQLLQNINQEEKITILVSSHLLSEIEKLVTHLAIINHGNLLFQGTLPELFERQKQSSQLTLKTDNPQKTIEILEKLGLTPKIGEDNIILPLLNNEKIAQINRELVTCGINVYQIHVVKQDLEKLFFEVINV